MRTESDLHAAFALLEREGDDYLAGSTGPRLPSADEPTHDLMPGPARPARRRRVFLPIAAIAASVTTALAVLAVGGGSTRTGAGGSGDATPVCVTPLPAAWQAALSARTVTVAGTGATAQAISPDGTVVVSWLGPDGSARIGTVIAGGPVNQVYRVAAPDHAWHFTADAHYATVTIGQRNDQVDDIVLVDLATGQATGLLADAPPGSVPWDPKQPILQDGTLYWLGDADHAGQLYSYDIASRTYGSTRVDLEDTRQNPNGFHWNPLGFGWNGGSIPASGLPPVHPPLSDRFLTLARDGSTLAWSYYDDAATVHWTDRSGATRDFEQHVMRTLQVEAVAGPYVFLDPVNSSVGDRVSGDVEVLDTRTGAMADTGLQATQADTGLQSWWANHSAAGLVTLSPRRGDTIRVLDTAGLPGLHC